MDQGHWSDAIVKIPVIKPILILLRCKDNPMALIHSMERSGNFLFRYRGQIPVILILAAIPVIYFTLDNNLTPFSQLILTVIAIISSLKGSVIRAIAIGTTPKGTSGRNTEKQVAESLNTTGIYSMVRHPLYLGNYLMWSGLVLFTFNAWFFAVFSLVFWIYYERIMFAEERFLERKFGEEYMKWSQTVPAFIPDPRKHIRGKIRFSLKSVLRREYSGILATVLCFAFIDHFRYYLLHHHAEPFRVSTWVLLFTILMTVILRTLKHHSRLLNEQGRS